MEHNASPHNQPSSEPRVESSAPASASQSAPGLQGISWPIAFLAGCFMIAGSVFYLGYRLGPASPGAPLDGGDLAAPGAAIPEIGDRDVILGNPNAPVTLIEYGDYQCSFCGRFHTESYGLIVKDYVQTGKVRMIYRDIAFLGPESKAAALATECSKDQGKFWQFHDALYTEEVGDGAGNNGSLNRALFLTLAGNVGMNTSDFAQCFDEKRHDGYVAAQSKAASSAGITSTPTVFINNRQIIGAQPYIEFQAVIEEELAKI